MSLYGWEELTGNEIDEILKRTKEKERKISQGRNSLLKDTLSEIDRDCMNLNYNM